MSTTNVFDSAADLAHEAAEVILRLSLSGEPKHIALSGGSTPLKLFEILSVNPYDDKVLWSNLHFWWVDERCVDPMDPESNFGQFKRLLADKIGLFPSNIHAIDGSHDSILEVQDYNQRLATEVPQCHGVPCFDLIFLGMGDDGHTASIFKDNEENIVKGCELTTLVKHPEKEQRRVTVNMNVINNSRHIIFLVTGESKSVILDQILKGNDTSYPAGQVVPQNGILDWYVDEAAFGEEH
jgi:6-phosphogluconolactonase